MTDDGSRTHTGQFWGKPGELPGHSTLIDDTVRGGRRRDDERQWHGPDPGTLIDDLYRVVEPIGVGGMGAVVRARDERLDRDVAIKFIQPSVLTARSRARFLTEARAMARVRHANVVEIYTYGEVGQMPYFVMEFVPGSTLHGWLRSVAADGGLPPLDEALGLLDQTCLGLAAIHASGAVHGDLKPANILIGPAFRAAITDLGLARVLDTASEEDFTVGGTPNYMSPDATVVGVPEEYAPRSDVFSLGVMAFEALSGELPFERDGLVDIMNPEPARSITEVSEELEPFAQVLAAALELDPRSRTESAEVFRKALFEASNRAAHVAPATVRIAIADDDEDFLALARETLEFAVEGSAVQCVTDGRQMLELVERDVPSLAVIDLDMPGMNGIELTGALRGRAATASMPIIVCTASGGAPDWKLLSDLGANGFLVKPIDPYALASLARRTLAASE